MRNAMAYAGKTQRRVVSAWVGTAFAQDDAEAARKQWRQVADQLRPRVSKPATLMDNAEADVLAYMNFPAQHRAKIHSANPLERLNGEIKRRSDVVGIFPDEAAVIRLVGALLLEQNDEWAVQRARYMSLSVADDMSGLGSARSVRFSLSLLGAGDAPVGSPSGCAYDHVPRRVWPL
jgi:putative transposase